MKDPSMSKIVSGMSEFDNIEYLMYISFYIEGHYIDDRLLSISNKSKQKKLLYRDDDWINLLQMEDQLIHMMNAIIYQIRENGSGQLQPNLTKEWGVLTVKTNRVEASSVVTLFSITLVPPLELSTSFCLFFFCQQGLQNLCSHSLPDLARAN